MPELELGARRVLLARGHRRDRSAASTAPTSGTVHDVYRVGENEVFVVERRAVRRVRPAGGPRVHPDLRAAPRRDRRRRRGARPSPGAVARRRTPTGRKAPRRTDAPAQAAGAGARDRRRPADAPTPAEPSAPDAPAEPPAPSHDPRDRRPDPVPGDGRGPAGGQHPGPDPGAGPRDGPGPRPARVGPRPPPLGRRHAVRRGSGDGPAPRAGRRRARRAAPPGLDGRSCSTRAARSSARRGPPTSPTRSHLVFVCPRYEGVDERIRSLVDLELSIGDYVLTGGELPALVVIDAVLRLLPGAIDDASTTRSRSAPACSSTRSTPARRRSGAWTCPPILTSGDHGAVARWRRGAGASPGPAARRPDLLRRPTGRAARLTRPGARAILRAPVAPPRPLPNAPPAASAAHD